MNIKSFAFVLCILVSFNFSLAKIQKKTNLLKTTKKSYPVKITKAKTYQSTEFRTNLIELYSSEGCSSCPPAERWLARFKKHKELWVDFVPVEFHVDYWNYLGWLDKFSNKKFTTRQRLYARELGLKTIYTPGVILNGGELKSWNTYKPVGKGNRAGVLKLDLKTSGTGQVEFTTTNKKLKKIKVNTVLLGNGLVTKVSTGENAGETLRHEFVVLSVKEQVVSRDGNKFTANIKLPKTTKIKAKSYSVAVWVSEESKLRPLQAIGGDLQ